MQDTSNGLPLPRHVAEHSERRGSIIGHLTAAAAELASLLADTAERPYSLRTNRLTTGYAFASQAVHRTLEFVNGLNEYDIDTSRGDANLIVDAGSCMCWPFAPHPDCPVHPSSFRDGFSVRVPDDAA